MADTPQTPRVLAPHLNEFQHRLVRVVGKVTQLRGETAVIDAGGNVELILNRVCGQYLYLSIYIWQAQAPTFEGNISVNT